MSESAFQALVNSAVRQIHEEGDECDGETLATVLARRLHEIYNIHSYQPGNAKPGDENCWCPECGESGPYPNPCTTARIAVGDRDT